MAKFTVDTHLFRELGELLVGRDSTALIELVKNAYDADATEVTVQGEGLDQPSAGFIRIIDNGIGMNPDVFEEGFLRIASRIREQGERRSLRFGRRFTGAKGIGRLAAHKLARTLHLTSIAGKEIRSEPISLEATIDWDTIEAFQTLDELNRSNIDAVSVRMKEVPPATKSGTVITLKGLRRRWTAVERAKFISEVQTFSPPSVLVDLPPKLVKFPLLFDKPVVANEQRINAPFVPRLHGDFSTGEEYWQILSQSAHWIIEIDARKGKNVVYNIVPTRTFIRDYSDAEPTRLSMPHPDASGGPFFQARILVREGTQAGSREIRAWSTNSYGIRVFMEGFRVLPYGEKSNDWLSLDLDYANRRGTSAWLSASSLPPQETDENAFLIHLANRNYYGGIFLTQAGAPTLQMLVNREGFVPSTAYEHLVRIVRVGIDLCTRARAAAKIETRQERSKSRARISEPSDSADAPSSIQEAIASTRVIVSEARRSIARGDLKATERVISDLEANFSRVSEVLVSESAMLRVLASVGTQMAAFIHELNGLLGMSDAIEKAVAKIRDQFDLPKASRGELSRLEKAVADLRRSIERQASYLVDIITPDARRRRMRLSFAERFESARRLVEGMADRRSITIENRIPEGVKSPPMFPAELTAVFSNLLTNAVKAAGAEGKIRATATSSPSGDTKIRVENTGAEVKPEDGERWFRPFESTTTSVDPALGQGMGLGLPITRTMLEQYGAEIRFVRPSAGFSTALEISFEE